MRGGRATGLQVIFGEEKDAPWMADKVKKGEHDLTESFRDDTSMLFEQLVSSDSCERKT